MTNNPLGQSTPYPQMYNPELLVAIARKENRESLLTGKGVLPFHGADVWNAYELSFLNQNGKPYSLLGRLIFSADSTNLIESKSLKLYLNSLNQEKFDSPKAFAKTISKDLGNMSGSPVEVLVYHPDEVAIPESPAGTCLDDQEISCEHYLVSKALLQETSENLFDEITEEVLYTNLFRSNCPITNQPDWATVTISYLGKKLPHDLLLKYLVSYRLHNDYHENCIERIFCDLIEVFDFQSLTVEANFLRRGGLDINPVRTTEPNLNYKAFPRYSRQ